MNLPAIYLRSLSTKYSGPSPADLLLRKVSVTTLGSPPRIAILAALNAGKLPEPAPEDRLAAWIGTALHGALDASAEIGEDTEERLYTSIGGWILSGQADLYEPPPIGRITDWKFVLALAMKFGGKAEWTWQLDALSWLWRVSGKPVHSLRDFVTGIDWRSAKARQDPSYPQSPWMEITTSVKPEEEVKAAIAAKLVGLSEALDVLPLCSDEERWAGKDRKTGRVEYRRCNLCPVVSVCTQNQRDNGA
jgi:hypothetical protein